MTNDLGKGYTFTALTRMRKLFILLEKLATVSQQLSYGHYVELLPYEDINKVKYYIKIIEEQNLSIRQLRDRIKSNEYERLDEETKNKLITKKVHNVTDFVKNPIVIKNSNNYEIIFEKVLQKFILEDIESFMKELGHSFCFIGSEYKIRIGSNFNYIDLMIEKQSNKFVGNIELLEINDKVGELAICITPSMQNKHYGKETVTRFIKYCFQDLKINDIELSVYSHNVKAMGLYKKLGFVEYKRDINIGTYNNESIDDIYMKLNK